MTENEKRTNASMSAVDMLNRRNAAADRLRFHREQRRCDVAYLTMCGNAIQKAERQVELKATHIIANGRQQDLASYLDAARARRLHTVAAISAHDEQIVMLERIVREIDALVDMPIPVARPQ